MNCFMCNKEIKETDPYKHIEVDHYTVPNKNGSAMKDKTKYDLCPRCYQTTGLVWSLK